MAFQLGGNLLEACILAIIEKEDVYGYRLTQEAKEVMEVSESTLYPVLRRLQKDGFLNTYDEPFQGRNRRYYGITIEGKEKLKDYKTEWTGFKEKIDLVLQEGSRHE